MPANAVLVPWLSYARSMPACDVVVTHGGHGTLVRALSCGCAVVVCPAGGDMAENAARADWAGVGVRLPRRLLAPRDAAPRRRAGAAATRPCARAPAPPRHGCAAHDGARRAARELEAWAGTPAAMTLVLGSPQLLAALCLLVRSPDAARTRRTPAEAARPRAERRSRARR